jgi:hypothetical protein
MNAKTYVSTTLLCLGILIGLLPFLVVHCVYKTAFWLFLGKEESWREYVWKD